MTLHSIVRHALYVKRKTRKKHSISGPTLWREGSAAAAVAGVGAAVATTTLLSSFIIIIIIIIKTGLKSVKQLSWNAVSFGKSLTWGLK